MKVSSLGKEQKVIMAGTEAIRCEGLSKRFDKHLALDGLSLSVEQGSIFGFLGPNGAGKTTTLRLFTGLTNPSGGRVWVEDEEVSQSSLRLRSKVGYLPEAPAFYGWMTGLQFFRFTGELYGLGAAEAGVRAVDLLEEVGLSDAGRRKVNGYSRGMQQRLGLAQALVHRPEVLFLDEPASALDPMGRRDMLETISSLKGRTTVFISTHILGDVERVCDHVAIVNKGKLVTTGSMDKLRSQSRRPCFELELDDGSDLMPGWLAGVPWVTSVDSLKRNGKEVLRVDVLDIEAARKELPRLVYESGATLLKFDVVTASLEDIFIDLTEEREVLA